MTPRQRTLAVLHRQLPDRVPVIPGFGTWYASRIAGGDMFDVDEGRLPAGPLMAQYTRKYGCEMWYWVGYDDHLPEVQSDGVGTCETHREQVTDDQHTVVTTLRTTPGDLTSREIYSRLNPPHPTEGLIKDPARDWPRYHSFRGDRWAWASTSTVDIIPPEDLELGITSFVLLLPVDFWKGMRCETVAAVYDLYDGDPVMEEAIEWHTAYTLAQLRARLAIQPLPDMLHLQGSSSSLSLISPEIYRRNNIPFIQQVCALAHAADVPVQIHHCGRSAGLVEIVAEETAVDAIHPLEPPPGGDVDLRVLKQRFGDRLILMGNLNTYHLMQYGTPDEVTAAARAAIEAAAEGGGFMLTTGDQLGRDTPEANIIAMVEAAHRYGSY